MRTLTLLGLAGWIGVAGPLLAETGEEPSFPSFQEVLRLIRAHLPGVTEPELNRGMVQGLLDEFHPRVLLVTNAAEMGREANLVVRRAVYEGSFGYVRVGEVSPGLPAQFAETLAALQSSNRLQGWIVDLRFAGGEDYRAAAGVAGQFATREGILLRYDDVELPATVATNAPSLPAIALVNSETSGAAEALAAALRASGPVLILGSRTAGRAYAARSFPLGEQRELRVASAPVRLGDGQSLADGVVPDIEARVASEEERAWLNDPFSEPPGSASGTNRPRPRVDEAELVRRRERNGLPSPVRTTTEAVLPGPVLRDPALRRALDVLKGLAVVGVGRPR